MPPLQIFENAFLVFPGDIRKTEKPHMHNSGFPLFGITFFQDFQGLLKDEIQIFQDIFFIYRAEGMTCNDHRSLPHAAGSAVSPPAGPGQGPGEGPGGKST